MIATRPRLEAYVAGLPGGLGSFEHVNAKASIHRVVGSYAGAPITGLPEILQAHLDNPSAPSKWIPACHTLALVIALVEAQRLAPAAEGSWIRAAAGELFDSPMYRILMRAASPKMILKGANIRWSAFFRGCELRPTFRASERTCDLLLVAPSGLFNEDLARIFADVLRSALSMTDESIADNTLDLADVTDAGIRYVARW